MNWVKKHKLPAIEALQFNRQLYIKLENIWQTLYQIFNSTQNWQINLHLLNEIPIKPLFEWLKCFKVEFNNSIKNTIIHLLSSLIIFLSTILKFWWLIINTFLILSTLPIYVLTLDIGLYISRCPLQLLFKNQTRWLL